MLAVLIVAALGGVLLFGVLNARRQALTAPSVDVRPIDAVRSPESLPALSIPPEPQPAPVAPLIQYVERPAPPAPQPQPQPAPPTYVPYTPPQFQNPPPAPPRNASGTPLVIDNSTATARPTAPVAAGPLPATPGSDTDRARAGMFANRATTVMQGTIIPAVLETGFDSTRPGFARAIVSRNVVGFDGTRVLIPRGSRLIGEYRSDAGPGQNRALINWTRLIRPDGATINIGSPAADRLGRTGIRADVNSHFWERFSGAILQSALDVGVNLASRQANGTIIVPVQGSLNGVNQITQPTRVVPTLTVKPGTSISIFVARDLDFTEVEIPK
jgi:type IV secretion system protein VirB10